MGKGVTSKFHKYPVVICLSAIYTISCFIFMMQSPPQQSYKGVNSVLQYSGQLSGKYVSNKEETPPRQYNMGGNPVPRNYEQLSGKYVPNTKKTPSLQHFKGVNPVHQYSGQVSDKYAQKIQIFSEPTEKDSKFREKGSRMVRNMSLKQEDNTELNKTSNGLECNMTKYLSLNRPICNAVLNKGNNSAMSSIIMGDNSVLKGSNKHALVGSVQFFRDVFKPREDNCNIDKVILHCDWLRKSYLYGKESVTADEKLFPLAFAMKIHKGSNQAHRVLRYIYREHNVYCIHVDKKAEVEIYNEFKRIESCFDNIIVIDDRIDVVYSTIRQVEAELKCMDVLSERKEAWKYYINLTGQEFMLKTNLELVKIVRLMNGTNDIESYPVPGTEYHKFKQRTVIMKNFPVLTKQRKPPFSGNIKVHKGSAYGLFCRDFVKFILTDKFVKDFLEWLKDAYAPEELIWATLQTLPGTPGGRTSASMDGGRVFISRAVKWKMDKTVACHGKYVHWVCIYGLDDISWLLRSQNVVANKFYEDYEPLALNCVEIKMYDRLGNRGIADSFDLDVYKKLLHLKQ